VLILSIDASTHAGWALMDGEPGDLKPRIIEKGLIENDRPVLSFGAYPWCYIQAADSIATQLYSLILRCNPSLVVIEETNLGRSRYAQKLLEFIHSALLLKIKHWGTALPIKYISSSVWRQAVGAKQNKLERRNNTLLSKAKKLAGEMVRNTPGFSYTKALAIAKKKLGIRGKLGKKHISVRVVNDVYDLDLTVGDNDTAEAICLGMAFFRGAAVCDGDPSSQR
jgi:hypothetical protein